MTKPISLSIHRNTRDQREMHRVSRALVSDARTLAAAKGVAGYVIVGWNRHGQAIGAEDTTGRLSPIPIELVPEFVRQELSRRMLHPIDASVPPEPEDA